ncbi:MAG: hypothetical protein ACYC61_24120, partial [Isosphaeraceae bacterium]
GGGNGDFALPHDPSDEASHARDESDDWGRPDADGQHSEAAFDPTARPHCARAAGWAAASLEVLGDREEHLAAPEIGANILVATDAERMIQEAGGHGDLPSWSP